MVTRVRWGLAVNLVQLVALEMSELWVGRVEQDQSVLIISFYSFLYVYKYKSKLNMFVFFVFFYAAYVRLLMCFCRF